MKTRTTPIDVAPKPSPSRLNDNYRNDTVPNDKGKQLSAPQRHNNNNDDTTTITKTMQQKVQQRQRYRKGAD